MGTELEEYMEDALDRMLEPATCEDSLQKLDSLLGQLCILSNQMNLQSMTGDTTKTKSFISRTQKPILKVWRVPGNEDLVFGQFIDLQDKFLYNISNHIIQVLAGTNDYNDDLLILMNQVLQGCLLLHPPSRDLFKRKSNLKLLLRYLKSYETHSPKLVTTVIQTFVCLLVRNVPNLRIFEQLNGPQLICQIFTNTTENTVKHKSLEFLMFYLIPETETPQTRFQYSTESTSTSTNLHILVKDDGLLRRTMTEKLNILKPYLDNVDELINQLLEIKPFGKMKNIDW